MSVKIGNLTFEPALSHLDWLAQPTADFVVGHNLESVWVAQIDPANADTENFVKVYQVPEEISCNCIVVQAKRAERIWYVAVLVRADHQADINNIVRRAIDARKVSFAAMDTAVEITGMEYGGINPLGLPANWQILVDDQVVLLEYAAIGSGIRGSKVVTTGETLAQLPNVQVLPLRKI
jgi:prolyl-tRNA editing enzyme YbaK/EbsC (Cys-tRNA(Pro) deacylase)